MVVIRQRFVFKEQDRKMNIQIFGTKKCNDTKKAERFFKERGIKFQFVDLREKPPAGSNIRLSGGYRE